MCAQSNNDITGDLGWP